MPFRVSLSCLQLALRAFPNLLLPGIFALLNASTLPAVESDPSKSTNTEVEDQVYSRFEKEIWPLLTRGDGDSCVGCHDSENKSELHFLKDARGNFKLLSQAGYFSSSDPDGLLGRLTAANSKKRMPRGRACPAWSTAEIESLREFDLQLRDKLGTSQKADEQFPSALLLPYRGPQPKSGLDNQFVSYRQLRGKIKTIFDDDWIRNGQDLFEVNIALFGGADFKQRFSESTKAAPAFLTGLDMMARDVSDRAFNLRTGPFNQRREDLPSPLDLEMPDLAYTTELKKLYETILFRAPTGDEIQQSFALLKRIYQSQGELHSHGFDLGFELKVVDPETGLSSTQSVILPVVSAGLSLYQEFIDEAAPATLETVDKADPAAKRSKGGRNVSGAVNKQKLRRAFHFKANQPGQLVRIYNAHTLGNVSFQSLEVRPVSEAQGVPACLISATNRQVQPEGAWKLEQRKELISFEDENNDKGRSTIAIGLSVPKDGEYELTMCWRESADNASSVLVEVLSHDLPMLKHDELPPVPPQGEAHYFIDESNDTVAFAEMSGLFRFDTNSYVEINNSGTHRRVTADAVRFASAGGRKAFLVDNDEAEGREHWKVYDSGEFKAYNQTGKDTYHDENAHKGELFLRYSPSLRTDSWRVEEFYHVAVGYPAKRDHEFHAPVIVRAVQSSPIVQIGMPDRGQVGAALEMDASHSYTVQGSHLKFHWQQTAGPPLASSDWNDPVLKFAIPEIGPQQAAWEALARALIEHPDFLFTRPPSLATTTIPEERRRLQLVKIAQDLLARAPTTDELGQLDRGKSFDEIVDHYLASAEFRDFYFHRIRLYFESQGSDVQDEPARLWCYVAFQDRPFQEILTADYTVDTEWQRQPRPAWYGQTGVLTTHGFIEGKPGLPHFNYAAQVAELFLGYVFEVPPEVVAQREGSTAASTTDPNSLCYSCHKVLTPLACQRNRWDDSGRYRIHDDYGLPIDDSDQGLVSGYPFAGGGLEAFARQAVQKERFVRTIINTHFTFYFGREMRYLEDERGLYKRLWDGSKRDHYTLRGLIKAIVTSPEYLEGTRDKPVAAPNSTNRSRSPKLENAIPVAAVAGKDPHPAASFLKIGGP